MRSTAIAFSATVLFSVLAMSGLASTNQPVGPFGPGPTTPRQEVIESQPQADAASGGEDVFEVPWQDVICNSAITFTGQGSPSGTNYDGILISGEAAFAERFVGQTRSTVTVSGNPHDALNNVASNPLTLQVGDPGQNVSVVNVGTPLFDVVDGLGPLGFPDEHAMGEGSLAMLFSCGQSELRLAVVGGDGGTATVQFFRADGSHIGNVVTATPGLTVHGFRRAGSVADIRGVSIYNDDPFGIGYDAICLTACTVPVESDTWGRIKARYNQ